MKIDGGAIIWARKTIDSKIFYDKPDKWFKIWFYLVAKVNHTDNERFKRGTCFLKYDWIMSTTGATKDEVKHCIRFLKDNSMLATQKATRGFTVEVLKYKDYQNLDSYKSHTKSHRKATQKPHRSHTINKNVKNVKNVKNTTTTTTKQEQKIIFNFDTENWKNIKPKNIEDWDKAYPACDIKLELTQMKEWLLSNPDKKKSRYRRFITNWLSRSQERGGSKEKKGGQNGRSSQNRQHYRTDKSRKEDKYKELYEV